MMESFYCQTFEQIFHDLLVGNFQKYFPFQSLVYYVTNIQLQKHTIAVYSAIDTLVWLMDNLYVFRARFYDVSAVYRGY